MSSFFLFLNKPIGLTSQQCLTRFKKTHKFDKVGHHGTLDPFASGLLLVGVNEATKFFNYIDDSRKTYEAVIRFGQKTDTLDCDGSVVGTGDVPDLDVDGWQRAFAVLTGKIRQTPPMYSAIKKDGKRLYELARDGIEVEREARDIEVFGWEFLGWQSPDLRVCVSVSRGTYVRVLAEQLAEEVGSCAHLVELTRTHLCGRDLPQAIDPQVSPIPASVPIAIPDLLAIESRLHLDPAQAQDLIHGKPFAVSLPENTQAQLFFHERFLGVGEVREGRLRSLRLCATQGVL